MKLSSNQTKALYTLEGIGLGIAIASQGSWPILILGLFMVSLAVVTLYASGEIKRKD